MKAVEFISEIKNNQIVIPTQLRAEINETAREVKVIVLLPDVESTDAEHFRHMTQEQFLKGYADSDAIYDHA